jgi:hypothetical protein
MSIERLEKLESELQDGNSCVFCSHDSNFFADIVRAAYRAKHPQEKNPDHTKDPALSDSLRVAGFMMYGFIYNDWDTNSNKDFTICKIENYEDIRQALLDPRISQFFLYRTYYQMYKHHSWLDLWAADVNKKEEDRRFKSIEQINQEAARIDKLTKIEAQRYFEKARECVKLARDFIKNYDLSNHVWKKETDTEQLSESDYERFREKAQEDLGLSLTNEAII